MSSTKNEDNDLSDLISAWNGFVNILGILWLVILIFDLSGHLSQLWKSIFVAIWGIFILDYIIRLFFANNKLLYLRKNLLTLISLIVPVFRTLAIFRTVQLIRFISIARGLKIITMLSSLNRGMRSFKIFFRGKKIGYVSILTAIVIVVGASGMYSFEKDYPGSSGFSTFGNCIWWTAMMITTVGSQSWPVSPEGRILCFLLALYAFAVFGYITASIATFLIGK